VAVELATAYISLVPETSKIAPGVRKALGGVGREADAAGQSMGSRISSGLSKSLKVGAAAAGGLAAAGIGIALTKGFSRLTAIENAQAKMRGLGHDTETVDAIMKNALASVKGTAFGLGEAATTAAGAVAAGIKPGKDLEGVLKSVANSAAASGVSMEEMGAIYNKAASRGKAQNDILGQVAERGIPIYQALAEQMGVTAEEVFDLASEGKVSFEQFEDAMTSASGTVAEEMGKTFTGSLANTWAAFGRIGANLLSGVFDKLAPALQGVTGWLEKMEPAAKNLGQAIGTGLDTFIRGLTGNVEIMDQSARPKLELLGLGIRAMFAAFKDGDVTSDGLVGVFERIGAAAFQVREQVSNFIGGLTGNVEIMDQSARPKLELFGLGIRAMFDAFKYGDVTSDGFVGQMEEVGYAVRQVWDAVKNLDFSSWDAFKASLSDVGGATGKGLSSMSESLGKIAPKLGEVVGALPKLAGSVGTILGAGLQVLVSTLGFLADNIDTVVKVLPYIIAGYAAWRVASLALTAQSQKLQWAQVTMAPVLLANNVLRLINITLENRQTKARLANTGATAANTGATAANNAAQSTGLLTRVRSTAAMVAQRVAMVAATVAAKTMTVAQKALNLAMKMNPIGLVIIAITALVGALVWLYNNNETARRIIDKAWAAIKATIDVVVKWFKDTAWPWMREALKKMREAFSNAKEKITGAWDSIKTGISNGWEKIKGIFSKFREGLDAVKEKFTAVRDGIRDAWRGLGNIIARPINAVIEKVNAFLSGVKSALNQIPGVNLTGSWQIRKIILDTANATVGGGANVALASGGRVPGWSPHDRADNIPAMLTAGEYVLPVKATRSLMQRFGPGFLEALRQGLPGYASGGMIGGRRTGGALDRAWEAAVDLWNRGKSWVKDLFDRIMPNFGGSWAGLAAKGAIGSIDLQKVADLLTQRSQRELGGSANAQMVGSQRINYPGHPFGWASRGLPWQTIWSLIQAVAPEARMTSNYRPGSITASGIPSLHGMGRAVDIVSGNMAATFAKIAGLLPWSQLYYSPMGGRQIGYRDAAVHRMHFDHIHAALADGGLVAPVFDRGGTLAPGLNLINNQTGGPEPLRNADLPLELGEATLSRLESMQRRVAIEAVREEIRLSRMGG